MNDKISELVQKNHLTDIIKLSNPEWLRSRQTGWMQVLNIQLLIFITRNNQR